jgi:hypothetical protein
MDVFKVEPDPDCDTASLSSLNEDPFIDVTQEEYDIAVMENLTKVSVFQVLMATGMKMAVFWVAVPCSLVHTDWRFTPVFAPNSSICLAKLLPCQTCSCV